MEHVSIDERDGGVVVLAIDRPPANAMDVTLLGELVDAVAQVAADAPRALVLAGRPGCFSAGADLKAVPGYGPAQQREMVDGINEMALGVYELQFPVVGAITGHAIAGGLVLALCTDIRVASSAGRYGLDEVLATDDVLDRSLHVATRLAALSPEVYARTKRDLRAEALTRMREGAEADPLLERWVD